MSTIPPQAPAEDAPLLAVRDLRVQFDSPAGTITAVDGVSFELSAGRALGVVGESGSGKTVLSRVIMNLLTVSNKLPEEGEVRFRGQDLLQLRRKQLRKLWGDDLAMVFQDPMTSLNPTMKIGPQVTEPLFLHRKISKKAARARAEELLREVGIPEPARRLGQYPHELSGGMRQRVTIAIALACDPVLLIADEPTTALDVTVQAQILDLLDRERTDRHMGLILISHDLGVVEGRTDDVNVMYAGRVVESAPTASVFKQPRHPYTESLIASMPKIEDPSHTRLAAIPGHPPHPLMRPQGCKYAPRCRYAQSRCLEEDPGLMAPTDQDGDRQTACFYPPGTDRGEDALARNVAAGHTATGLAVQTAEVR